MNLKQKISRLLLGTLVVASTFCFLGKTNIQAAGTADIPDEIMYRGHSEFLKSFRTAVQTMPKMIHEQRAFCLNADADTADSIKYDGYTFFNSITNNTLNKSKSKAVELILSYIDTDSSSPKVYAPVTKKGAEHTLYNGKTGDKYKYDYITQILIWAATNAGNNSQLDVVSDSGFTTLLAGDENMKKHKYDNAGHTVSYFDFDNLQETIPDLRGSINQKYTLEEYIKIMLTTKTSSGGKISAPSAQTASYSPSESTGYNSTYFNQYKQWAKRISEIYTVPSFTKDDSTESRNNPIALYLDTDYYSRYASTISNPGIYHTFVSDENGVIEYFIKKTIPADETDAYLKAERDMGFTKLLKMFSDSYNCSTGIHSSDIYCTYNPNKGLVHIFSKIALPNGATNMVAYDGAYSDILLTEKISETSNGEAIANCMHWIPQTEKELQNVVTVRTNNNNNTKLVGTADVGETQGAYETIGAYLTVQTEQTGVDNESLESSVKLICDDTGEALNQNTLSRNAVAVGNTYHLEATYTLTNGISRGNIYEESEKETEVPAYKAKDRLSLAPDEKLTKGSESGTHKYKVATKSYVEIPLRICVDAIYNGELYGTNGEKEILIRFDENRSNTEIVNEIKEELANKLSSGEVTGIDVNKTTVTVSKTNGLRTVNINLVFKPIIIKETQDSGEVQVTAYWGIGSNEIATKPYVYFTNKYTYTNSKGNDVICLKNRIEKTQTDVGYKMSPVKTYMWKTGYDITISNYQVTTGDGSSETFPVLSDAIDPRTPLIDYTGLALARYEVSCSKPKTTYTEKVNEQIVYTTTVQCTDISKLNKNRVVYTMLQAEEDNTEGNSYKDPMYWYRDNIKINSISNCAHFVPYSISIPHKSLSHENQKGEAFNVQINLGFDGHISGHRISIADYTGERITNRITSFSDKITARASYSLNPVTYPRNYIGKDRKVDAINYDAISKYMDTKTLFTIEKNVLSENNISDTISLIPRTYFKSRYTETLTTKMGSLKYDEGWLKLGNNNKDAVILSGQPEGFQLMFEVEYYDRDKTVVGYEEAHPNTSLDPEPININKYIYVFPDERMYVVKSDGDKHIISTSLNLPENLYASISYINENNEAVSKRFSCSNYSLEKLEKAINNATSGLSGGSKVSLFGELCSLQTDKQATFDSEIPIFDSPDIRYNSIKNILTFKYKLNEDLTGLFVNSKIKKQDIELEVFTPLIETGRFNLDSKVLSDGGLRNVPAAIYGYGKYKIHVKGSVYDTGGIEGYK